MNLIRPGDTSRDSRLAEPVGPVQREHGIPVVVQDAAVAPQHLDPPAAERPAGGVDVLASADQAVGVEVEEPVVEASDLLYGQSTKKAKQRQEDVLRLRLGVGLAGDAAPFESVSASPPQWGET